MSSAPQPASYFITTSKTVMGQVSKEGSTINQVEGLDAIPTVIYRKEDPSEKGIRKSKEEERERN